MFCDRFPEAFQQDEEVLDGDVLAGSVVEPLVYLLRGHRFFDLDGLLMISRLR